MDLEEENVSIKLVNGENPVQKRVVRFMSALFLLIPFFIAFGMTVDIWNSSHSLKLNSKNDGNFTAKSCDYMKRFPLTNTLFVGVCLSKKGSMYVEFRRFLGGKPASLGIQLSPMQWLYLKKTLPFVDRSLRLVSSRDYSSNINRTEI